MPESDDASSAALADLLVSQNPLYSTPYTMTSATYAAEGGEAADKALAEALSQQAKTREEMEKRSAEIQKGYESASEAAQQADIELISGRPTAKEAGITPPVYQPYTMQDVQNNIFSLLTLATVGGIGSRRHAMGAMKSFGAMLQG